MRKPEVGQVVFADGFGRVMVEAVADHDTLIQIKFADGETAWTDSSLCRSLDSGTE